MRKKKSLPNGLPEKVIKDAYDKELSRHSNQLIQEIRDFIKEPISSETKDATVEIFPDEYGDGHASIGLYLNGVTTKHIEFASYAKDLPLIDIQSYNENDIYVADLVVDLVKYWFAECWYKACGWDYPLAISVYGHEGFGEGNVIDITSKS